LIIPVQVRPKSGRNAVVGVSVDGMGRPALVVTVTAPPHDGAANLAVQMVLADYFGAPKTAFALCQGAKSRHKQFRLTSADPTLIAHVSGLLRGEQQK